MLSFSLGNIYCVHLACQLDKTQYYLEMAFLVGHGQDILSELE